MKKSFINALYVLLVGAMLSLTGCKDPEVEQTPIFPEKVSAAVAAGESFTFTINPNMSWTMKIPNESATFFKFIFGASELYTLSGNAGTHTITVAVSNIEEFDVERRCDIEMTMGGETKVVATIVRSGLERTLNMYFAEYNADSEVFTQAADESEEQYVYGTTPAERLDWLWSESNGKWMQRAVVESNFEWFISPSTPEWLDIRVRISDLDWRNINELGEEKILIGRTELFFQVNEQALPLEDATCNIEMGIISLVNNVDGATFEAVASYPTEMEGCKSVCEVSLASSLTFNAAGEYYQASSESYNEYAMGYIRSPRGAKLVVLNKDANGRYSPMGTEWITLTEESFPEEAGEVGVWERALTLDVEPFTETTHREGVIAAIPLSAVKAGNYKTEDYIVCSVLQEGVVEEEDKGVIYPNDEEVLANLNGKFESLVPGSWPYQGDWSNIPNGYKLTYNCNDSADDLIFTIPFSRYEIYGFDAFYADKYDLESCWVTVEPSAKHKELENGYIVRSRLGEFTDESETAKYTNTMAGWDGENEATIVFFDENNAAYALIYVVLDPNYYTPIDRPEGSITFASDKDYASLGASIEEIVKGDEDYSAEFAYQSILQYRLRLNANCLSANLFVPEYNYSYAYASWVTTKDSSTNIVISVDPSAMPQNGTTEHRVNISLYGAGNTHKAQILLVYEL